LTGELVQKTKELIVQAECLIFQDYDKGVLTENGIQSVINLANEANVPTTVDPKKRNFLNYGGVTLFKPNLKEINDGLGLALKGNDFEGIASAAQGFLNTKCIQKVLITLSENGALLVTENGYQHVAAHERNIVDVSGAGDTVISVISSAVALGLSDANVLEYSNLAGGLVCEKIGVVPVDREELIEGIESLIG